MFPWITAGRANSRAEGVAKRLFDDLPAAQSHSKILGVGSQFGVGVACDAERGIAFLEQHIGHDRSMPRDVHVRM